MPLIGEVELEASGKGDDVNEVKLLRYKYAWRADQHRDLGNHLQLKGADGDWEVDHLRRFLSEEGISEV